MPKFRREDEPDESTKGEQTEEDSEGHLRYRRDDEETPDPAESGTESDEGENDSEGHGGRYHG
jgi:hypothetical protein